MRGLTLTILLIVALALYGGWQAAGGIRDIIARDELRERVRIENEAVQAELAHRVAMEPWRRAGEVAAGGIVLFALAGLSWTLITYAHRRAGEIRPGPDGQFPIIQVQVGDAIVIHDPNRQLAGTVVYTTADLASNVVVMPVLPDGAQREQLTVVSQAQTVQLATAVHRAFPTGDSPTVAEVARRLGLSKADAARHIVATGGTARLSSE